MLSQSDVCSENEELGLFPDSDPLSSANSPSLRSYNSVAKHNTDLEVSNSQLTSAGFDPVQPSGSHTSVSEFTHPLTAKSFPKLGSEFGCIPLGDFKLYTGPPVIWQSVPDIIQAHKLIRASGVPNFWGQRIPVNSDLNIPS